MIEHVWFDTSGTLYRETPDFQTAHDNYLFEVMATVTGERDIARLQVYYKELSEKYGSNSAVFQALGQPADYWQRQFEKFDTNSLLAPNDEITKTLDLLRQRVPISVFTNLRIDKLRNMLDHLTIPLDYFTHVLSAVDVGKPKPSLEGFYKMIELSNVDADKLLYVGDKVAKDIKPAKQVGVLTCLVWSKSSEADFSIASFEELLGIVSKR